MDGCKRLVFAFALLSLMSPLALSQERSGAYLDEQIQKRIDEIEGNLSEIKELISLRTETKIPAWERLGITGKTVRVELPDEPYNGGVEITAIEPGSHAEAMGLDAGDVIVGFDGAKTPSLDELVVLVDKASARNDRFPKMVLSRDGKLYVTSPLARLPTKRSFKSGLSAIR